MRWWRRTKGWISDRARTWERKRGLVITAGVALVAVPTVYSVFPSFTESAWWVRTSVLVGWGLVAGLVVWGTVVQSERVESVVERVRQRRDEQRLLAKKRITPLLLTEGTRVPSHYEFRIYVYDWERDRLVVSYDPKGMGDSTEWEPGKGAVGVAFANNERVVVRGRRVSDGTFGLSKEQQERNKRLQVVAAHSLRDEHGKVVGVLSASSTEDDGTFATPDGLDALTELAIIVSRVLIDLRTHAE